MRKRVRRIVSEKVKKKVNGAREVRRRRMMKKKRRGRRIKEKRRKGKFAWICTWSR